MFEIITTAAILQTSPRTELYPLVAGRSGVEVRIDVSRRWVYVEMKALGYSVYDLGEFAGTHSIDSMQKQVSDALAAKLSAGKQLAAVVDSAPGLLFLALNSNADQYAAEWAIGEFFESQGSNLAGVVLFGSALCRQYMRVFRNPHTNNRLSAGEIRYLEEDFYREVVRR